MISLVFVWGWGGVAFELVLMNQREVKYRLHTNNTDNFSIDLEYE